MKDPDSLVINKSFNKLLFPTTIGCLALVIVSLIDVSLTSYFYGANGLTVVSLFIPLLTLWGCIYEGLGTGASALFTQSVGANEIEKGRDGVAMSNSLTLILCALIVLVCFGTSFFISANDLNVEEPLFNDAIWYGRIMILTTLPLVFNNYLLFLIRTSAPKIAALSNGIQVILNIVLDILFMGPMALGIKGAALALFVASTAALCLTLHHMFSSESSIKLTFRMPDCKAIKKIYPYALNMVSDNITDFCASLFINVSVLLVFGMEIASIVYIINYIMQFVIYVGMGFSYSATPIMGVYYGEKNNNALNYMAHKGMRMACGIGIILAILIGLFSDEIAIYLFHFEYPQYSSMCNWAIRLYAVSIPLYMINTMMICYGQQTEKFNTSLTITVLRGFLLVAILIFFTLVVVDAKGLWWSFLISEIVTLVCWLLYTNRKKKEINATSFLCLPQYSSPYKAEMNIIISAYNEAKSVNKNKIESFLRNQQVSDNTMEDVLNCIEIIYTYAFMLERVVICIIKISVTHDNKVNIKTKINIKSNGFFFNNVKTKQSEEEQCEILKLKKYDSNFQSVNILSFRTFELTIH